jgi:hypothetical protein
MDVTSYQAVVRDPAGAELIRDTLEVPADQAVAAKFRAEQPGAYTIELIDDTDQVVATRSVEVRAANLEWRAASRNMRMLEHWARASHGVAIPIEACDDPAALLRETLEAAERAKRESRQPVPAGVNGWTLSTLLGCLALEWLLRKRWGLT